MINQAKVFVVKFSKFICYYYEQVSWIKLDFILDRISLKESIASELSNAVSFVYNYYPVQAKG